MSDETLVRLRFDPRIEGKNEIKQSWSEILEWLKEKASEVWAATGEEAKQAMNDGFKAVGDIYDELGKSFKTTTTSAIKGSIVPLFKGEMDDVEDIWSTAWDSMALKTGKLFITVMVINNKPHPACDSGGDSALGPIKTRPADDHHLPAVFCVAA